VLNLIEVVDETAMHCGQTKKLSVGQYLGCSGRERCPDFKHADAMSIAQYSVRVSS